MISIVGAGITGLVTAAYLKKAGHKVQLFDSRSQAGGNIRSQKLGKYLLELGPNSLVLDDFLYDFLEEWELTEQMVHADPKAKNRYILKDGKYRKLPRGPLSLVRSRTFSSKAKRALLRERKLPPQHEKGDSIDDFFRKRLGDEWTDYVVHPFVSGVFAGNPEELLIAEAFPRILELEEEHASLLKGMMSRRKSREHSGTISFRHGLQSLTDVLADFLKKDLQLSHPLLSIRPNEKQGYELQFKQKEVQTDFLVLAIPSYQAGRLLKEMDERLGQNLNAVEYPPVSMVFSAYKRKAVRHKLDGFGALHNHKEKIFSLGSIFNSSIFPGRCPEDEVLLTSFVGGDLYPERAKLDDQGLFEGVHDEISSLLRIRERPVFQHVQRWPRAIPQYKKNALPSQEGRSVLEDKGIYLGGNWVGGISVPDSIRSGKELARRILLKKNLREDGV